MKLDCQITELLKRDFNALWRCEQHGDTLEISTPYLMPDSSLLTLMMKFMNGRYIVCEGGIIWDLISQYSTLPVDEITPALEEMARKFRIRQGEIHGDPLFFKECENIDLVSSLAFDIANFSLMATSALVSISSDEIGVEPEHRFETKADVFLKTIRPTGYEITSRADIVEVPGIKFSAVIKTSSKIWLVSYVNGSTFTNFRRCLSDTMVNFRHAWESSLQPMIKGTIPLINNEATGYQPMKMKLHMSDLARESHDGIVNWTEKDHLTEMLRS